MKHWAAEQARAFGDILFIRLIPENSRHLKVWNKIILYLLAAGLFYVPILFFALRACWQDKSLFPYFFLMLGVHILAKFMLHNSKRIQRRFAAIKSRQHFFIRTWLIAEYVVFMWLVYLFYPLACILTPLSLLGMFVENLFGSSLLFDSFTQNADNFLMVGGIVSYILFILADGYKKLRAGFLPDYLGLYALLTVMSGAVESLARQMLSHLEWDFSAVTLVISQIFAMSNDSMNMVASAMTLFFALYSLYSMSNNAAETEPKEKPEEETAEPVKNEETPIPQ